MHSTFEWFVAGSSALSVMVPCLLFYLSAVMRHRRRWVSSIEARLRALENWRIAITGEVQGD